MTISLRTKSPESGRAAASAATEAHAQSSGSAAPGAATVVKPGILGAFMLAFAAAVLGGARLPLVASDRDAFVVLIVLGWITCTAGAGATIQALGWRHPITIAGCVLGLVALALIALVITGVMAPLASLAVAIGADPAPPTDRVAFVCLTIVLLAKCAVGLVRFAVR